MTTTSRDTIRPRRALAGLSFAALALLAIAGCGTGTSATGEWRPPRSANVPFSNVLVVGISANSRVRRSFEEQLVQYLSAGGTKASASILLGSAMGSETLTRDAVLAMVKDTGADAVVVTKLIRRTVKAGETQETVDIKIGPQITVYEDAGLTEIFASNITMTEEPGQLTAKSKAALETSVYDVADKGRVVYKIATTSKFTEINGDAIIDITGNIAEAVSKQLRSDHLVR